MSNKYIPAFPRDTKWNNDGTTSQDGSCGMSLRDWFAGQYLIGLASNPKAIGTAQEWAKECYDQADAMLEERNR
jgi:hypothetical protein